MLIIVTGASRSGKSKIAEQITEKLCPGEKIYLATMISTDGECKDRISLHQSRRAGKGYLTVEKGTHLEELSLELRTTVLLEDLSNLVANEMYDPVGVKENTAKHVVEGIRNISRQSEHLVIVANEVFSDFVRYEESRHYLEILGEVQKKLVKEADLFIEAVFGIAVCHKGGEKYKEVLECGE